MGICMERILMEFPSISIGICMERILMEFFSKSMEIGLGSSWSIFIWNPEGIPFKINGDWYGELLVDIIWNPYAKLKELLPQSIAHLYGELLVDFHM